MKRYTILSLLLIGMLVLNGCDSETTHVCAVCGNEATHTINGPAEYIEESGVNLSDCEIIVNNVYSAYLCDSCDKVPVARDPADNK